MKATAPSGPSEPGPNVEGRPTEHRMPLRSWINCTWVPADCPPINRPASYFATMKLIRSRACVRAEAVSGPGLVGPASLMTWLNFDCADERSPPLGKIAAMRLLMAAGVGQEVSDCAWPFRAVASVVIELFSVQAVASRQQPMTAM